MPLPLPVRPLRTAPAGRHNRWQRPWEKTLTFTAGIHFGMTNSAVAVLEDGSPEIVVRRYNAGRDLVAEERSTPSVVAFAADGTVLVGARARFRAEGDPQRAIRWVKRRLGTGWTATIDGKTFTPEQISAFILQTLMEDTKAYTGESVKAAAIAVPAYFDDAQCKAIWEACRIAGLTAWTIDEPTAAVLGHRLGKQGQATILVFHLGGVTLNVSLLKTSEGQSQYMATSGDSDLGGEDWTQRIIDWLVQDFKSRHGIDVSMDENKLRRLRSEAEAAKIQLSQSAEVQIRLPYFANSADGSVLDLDTRLTRKEFQRMTADLIDRCREPVQQVIRDAGIKVRDIDHVILVGGSTWMPAVVNLVKSLTRGNVSRNARPEEVIALGACLYAATLTEQQVKEVQQAEEAVPIPQFRRVPEEEIRLRPLLAPAAAQHPDGDETAGAPEAEVSTGNAAGLSDQSTESSGGPAWLALFSALAAAGGVLLGMSAAIGAASKDYPIWTSVVAVVAYVLFGLAAACLVCATRKVPVPYPLTRRSEEPRLRRE
jgi:molecular chaperone DnaK (HSP70)